MGAFIAGLRKERGLTQKQLAERLGVTDKAVSKWERDAGYPDITLLAGLADALGVTPGELLRCVREAAPPAEEPLALIERTYEYADRVSGDKATRRLRLAAAIFSAAVVLSALVCMICDLSINGRFTWVVYPVSALVYGWLVLAPPLFFRRQRVFFALLSASIFTLPFLLVLSMALAQSWFFPLGVPVALASLSLCWLVYLTAVFSRSPWYAASMAFLFIPVINLTVEVSVGLYIDEVQLNGWDLVSAFLSLVASAVFFGIGRLRKEAR